MATYTNDPASFPDPIDLTHHLSRSTKAREASQIKKFYQYFSIPGIAQLAGGSQYLFLVMAQQAHPNQVYQTTTTFHTIPSKPRSPTRTDGIPHPTSPSIHPPMIPRQLN